MLDSAADLGQLGAPPTKSATPQATATVIGKRKRVVPDALRRRTAVSCDRCKLRRAKCIRNTPGEKCSNCAGAGVHCESTLPRKHRVYGSLESLSLRYRALDALVKGLLPEEDLHDVESLLKIGKARGIPMPDPESTETNPEIFQNSPQAPPTPAPDSVREEFRTSNSSTPPLKATPKRVRDEKLIHAPHGVGHYVGPSSSLGFAAVVRKMVARISHNPKFLLSRRQQKTLQAEFVKPTSSGPSEAQRRVSASSIDANSALRPQDGGLYLRVLDAQDKEDPTEAVFTLPDKQTADTLKQAFFDHVHPNYPLFHQTMFQLRYEAMWKSETPPDESDPGWICVLSLIFVFGSQELDPFGSQATAIQKRYLRIARCYVDHLVSTTSLQNIQALMLLQLYYHNVGERNASWMLLGCASRMAIALGMHREGANVGFDELEQNIRKQIWWTVYVFERNLCIILGRPSAIEESEVTITFPEEAIESSICLPRLTAVTVELTRLAFRAKQQIYNASEVRSPSDGDALTASAQLLLHELQLWHDRLPSHLRVGRSAVHIQQRRAVLLLNILYHHVRALVTRPFLISRVNKQIDMVEQQDAAKPSLTSISNEAVRLADQCVTDAQAVIALGTCLYKEGILNGTSWLDVYYIYQSCFVMCLNFIPQLADIPESPEDQARKASVDELLTLVGNMPLAATFRTLVQVGCQFASLVGALSDPRPESTATPKTATNHEIFPSSSSSSVAPVSAPAYPRNVLPLHMETYHSQPPAQTSLGASVNQQDWMNATQIPWDFLGRTTYGQAHGFSQEWYAVQAGTYDDMMFPTVVGGTFGHGSLQNEWGSNGFRIGDDCAAAQPQVAKDVYVPGYQT
ncbi:uncharacterized protein PV09_04398 [Verruconis gallopava]|uniref:Zn(2)-C6 fungal-type domain-containing protein n=1 Tax=Verruconis gallopava TaxID=253628 RepID=A0A0D2AZW8_9PEZI|nr:uncharacterized protein PV09_04398 [Verruconis gallopava]KIW04654.1 hypothetical protein PV09_04398 [Verruconis gallopava]